MPSPVKKTGINMELNVSKELAAIIGTAKGEKISRPQVVKRLWAYLKENKLQDPENGTFVNGVRVGKDRQIILEHCSVISLLSQDGEDFR